MSEMGRPAPMVSVVSANRSSRPGQAAPKLTLDRAEIGRQQPPRSDRFYEDAFVKPSLIAASGTPHEDGYRGMSACSRLWSGSEAGVWGAFEPALGRTSIRAGPVGSAPDAQFAQSAWT